MDDSSHRPLADVLRPSKLADFVGQEHLVGEGKILKKMIEADQIASIILFIQNSSLFNTSFEHLANQFSLFLVSY